MRAITPKDFNPETAWAALDIAVTGDATVRLHWTNAPYIWHVNDGPEVSVPLDGQVVMHVRDSDGERQIPLGPGDIFHAEPGDEHVACPDGATRILVIEKGGSV